MFANLRQGSQVFVLHKTSTPFIEMGNVENVSNIPIMGYYPNIPQMPIDITIRIGDKVIPYKQLPANAEVANGINPNGGEEIILACTKDAITNEVQAMKQKSIEIINSVNYHKQRIEVCDTLLNQLNPEVAEKKQQQQEISELRGQVSSLTSMISDLKKELGLRPSSSVSTPKN